MTFLRGPQRQTVYQSLAGLNKAAHDVCFFLPQAFQLDDGALRGQWRQYHLKFFKSRFRDDFDMRSSLQAFQARLRGGLVDEPGQILMVNVISIGAEDVKVVGSDGVLQGL